VLQLDSCKSRIYLFIIGWLSPELDAAGLVGLHNWMRLLEGLVSQGHWLDSNSLLRQSTVIPSTLPLQLLVGAAL
jgi:hypothetical protein